MVPLGERQKQKSPEAYIPSAATESALPAVGRRPQGLRRIVAAMAYESNTNTNLDVSKKRNARSEVDVCGRSMDTQSTCELYATDGGFNL